MTAQRPFPSDVPGNQPQSRIAIIRGILSADLRNAYLIDFQGSVDGPETGYYSGTGTLATGARVRALWSPDMGSWDIQGTTQSLGDESSAELAVATGTDDGGWNTPSSGYGNIGNEFTVQEIGGSFEHAFVRFTNVQIAQGATVQAGAFIRLSVHGGSNSTTINALIGAYDVDNGSAPGDKAACETQWSGRTTAETYWIEAISFTHDTVADTPDITAVLQEIVSRSGWVIGNAIVFLIRGQAGANHQHAFHAYDDPSSPAPVLHYTKGVPAAAALGTHDILSLDHTDVDEDDTPADGEVLTWNDPPGEWAAEAAVAGHDEAHTVASHSDTTGTGPELDELTGGGVTGLHAHAGDAPSDADYLVGTAQAGLSAEIVVGPTPGGELDGTWAAPTVDAMHSGSAHHAEAHAADHADGATDELVTENQATAATNAQGLLGDGTGAWALTDLATQAELDTHAGAADPHTGYRLESADHSHASTGAQAGQISHDAALTGVSADDHHDETHVVDSTGPHSGSALTIGHVLRATSPTAFAFAAIADDDVPSVHSGSAHHTEAHAPESHTGQGATAAELETLTDGSDADALHVHPASATSASETFAFFIS